MKRSSAKHQLSDPPETGRPLKLLKLDRNDPALTLSYDRPHTSPVQWSIFKQIVVLSVQIYPCCGNPLRHSDLFKLTPGSFQRRLLQFQYGDKLGSLLATCGDLHLQIACRFTTFGNACHLARVQLYITLQGAAITSKMTLPRS